jgi:calcineurin-like phosphoesterase family protein
MTRVFYWADLHVGHELVALDRGYASCAEHDEALAQSWAESVTKKDTVWLLGDLASSNPRPALELLDKLPGTKRLVAGNHDPVHPLQEDAHRHFRKYLDVFASVHTSATRRLGNHFALLSHFPYEGDGPGREDRYSQWRLRDEGAWLIHGHVHQAWRVKGRQINVGFDHWPTPASAEELDNIITEHEVAAAA